MSEQPIKPKWATDNARIADEIALAIDHDLGLPLETPAAKVNRLVLAAKVREGSTPAATAIQRHMDLLEQL